MRTSKDYKNGRNNERKKKKNRESGGRFYDVLDEYRTSIKDRGG